MKHVKYSTVREHHALGTGTGNNIGKESIIYYKTHLCRIRNIVPIWRWKIHLSHQNLVKKHFLVISTSIKWKPNKTNNKTHKEIISRGGFNRLLEIAFNWWSLTMVLEAVNSHQAHKHGFERWSKTKCIWYIFSKVTCLSSGLSATLQLFWWAGKISYVLLKCLTF